MNGCWMARGAPRISTGHARRDGATPRGLARLRLLARDDSAVSMVEFAIVGPIFLLLILAVLENGLTLWTQGVLDNATRDAARLTLTGQSQNGGTAFATQLCSEISGLMNCASLAYRIQTNSTFGGISPTITYSHGAASGFSSYPTSATGGSAGQSVLVQVIYTRNYIIPWVGNLLSANGTTQILSTAAFENEPF